MILSSTGDIAFKILDSVIDKSQHDGNTDIIVSDINQAMLDVGKKRAQRLNINQGFISSLVYLFIFWRSRCLSF